MALEQLVAQAPPSEVVTFFQPLVDALNPFLGAISWLVGGIFGLYLIMVIARIYYERKMVKILRDIRYDLDQLNFHNGLKTSKQRKGSLSRAYRKLKESLHNFNIKRFTKKQQKNE
ncbi:hypothetical protein HOC13_02665 [Candidatus Woesearchaeota archaeon]|jgi:hypothetical protein|nr:hypothetical protein [Candidatus Woesearchaeota archaeon]